MPRSQLRLMGSFQFIQGEIPAAFRSDKERLLLAYLAIERFRPHSREALAGLLWPEQPPDLAHNNLRVTLHRLRQAVGDSSATPPLIDVSRDAIQLNQTGQLWIDALAFEGCFSRVEQHPHEALATCQECMAGYARAVALYQGDFLQGVYPADSLPFSEWALLQREHLHRQALRALFLLAAYHQRRGELDLALGYARRQLELEPWREEAHGQVMTILALQGEYSAALRQYERCRQVLWDELGVDPSEDTRLLYERILASRRTHRYNLPQHITPFLGRQAELNRVSEYLTNPACRLLTILGPGGIGKSRLALQAAEAQIYSFLHGVFLIELAGIPTHREMIRAIAGALELQFNPAGDPKTQLLDYLRQKEMLLVLDNYEHLLGSGETVNNSILKDLLENAPGLRLLVTSRQRLNLNQEWSFVLQGLSYPEDTFSLDLEKYEAVQLFIQSARRIDSGFELAKEEESSIVRICQLLQGLPLAIELAAAWTWVMSPAQIAQEIKSDLDFLAGTYQDLPERQRSLRATFEHSYRLLNSQEQQALCRLTIFPGSFDRFASEKIAEATLAVLTSLSDQSLIQYVRTENHGSRHRYRMHELIKQFSSEKLAQHPAEVERTKDRHRSFYMSFLNDRNRKVMGGLAQYEAGQEVSGEIENVRMALERAIGEGNLDELGHSLNVLMYSYEILGLFDEAERLFGKISRCMEEGIQKGEPAGEAAGYFLGRAIMYHGWYCMRLARFDQAIELTQKGLALSKQFGELEGYGLALNSLGVIARIQGKYPQSKSYLEAALKVLSDNRFTWSQAGALGNLGVLALLEGDLSLGVDYINHSLELFTMLKDEWGMANCLTDLGAIALQHGNLELAEKRLRQGLEIRNKLGQRWRVADSLNMLGELAYRRQEFGDAKREYQESLAILRDFGERERLASTLAHYSEVCTALGDSVQARESLYDSLKLAQEICADRVTVRSLLGLAALLSTDEGREQSVEILAAIVEHPSLAYADREKATNLLSEIQAELPPEVFQTASDTGKTKAVEDVVRDILRADW